MPEIVLEIGPDIGDVPVPMLPPGHEWASARLYIRAEPSVILTPPLEGPGDPAKGVPWVSVAWGPMRPLTALTITWVGTAPAADYVTVKVATGGVWFTPVPPGRVHPKSFQPMFSFPAGASPKFPPVMASALLLELRKADPLRVDSGEPDEATGHIEQVAITMQNPVIDLSVAVGAAPPVVHHKGRLGAPIDVDLGPALRAAPPGAALRLRASTTATVCVTWAPEALRRPQAPPPEPAILPVGLGETARWTQPLADERLVAAAGRVEWSGAAERSLREPAAAPALTLAQAVFPGQDAAQALGPLAEPPRGVDLWLLARSACAGVLRLVGERGDRPTDKPLAEAAWSLAAGEGRWISVPVPPGARGPLWLVCQATAGEALVARAQLPGAPHVALQRRDRGPWDLVDEPETSPHLHIRVRATDPAPTAAPVTVRRGDRAVLVPGDGPFVLSPPQLAALNQASGPLTVELTAPGRGAVTLAAWELRLAATACAP
jgi:hypothetical protein